MVRKSGLRFAIEPGIVSFIERDPAEAFPASIDQVPPVPPEIDQPVGVPEPDSKDPLTARLGLEIAGSR